MRIGSIDIGQTKTIVAIINECGEILCKETFATITKDCYVTLAHCCSLLSDLCRQLSCPVTSLQGIGVNVPGLYNPRTEMLLKAPFASWENVAVGQFFREKLKFDRLFVENDVKNCALGELYFGYGRQYENYIWVTVSTGIGGAIVQSGKLLRGYRNLAGEIGHVKVEYQQGAQCSCGAFGCLEAYASGTAITRETLKAIQEDPKFQQEFETQGLPQDARGCSILAEQGNPRAVSIYEKAGDYLARGIAVAVNLLDPQVVILGGGVARSMDLLVPAIRRRFNDYGLEREADIPILQTALGYEAALIGTAALVLERTEVFQGEDFMNTFAVNACCCGGMRNDKPHLSGIPEAFSHSSGDGLLRSGSGQGVGVGPAV